MAQETAVSLKHLISGGQTGVDRSALDAAIEAHFPKVAALWAEIRRLSARNDAHEHRIAALERRAGGDGSQREDAEAAVAKIVAELGLTRFSSRELLALKSSDAALCQALALVDTAREVGQLLGRCHRRGLLGRESKRGRCGCRWRCVTG